MYTESFMTRRLCKRLTEEHNVLCIALAGGQYQPAGLPDRYLCSHKWLTGIFIEFKVTGNDLTDHQAAMHRQLLARHVPVIVIKFIDDFAMLVNNKLLVDQSNTTAFITWIKEYLDDYVASSRAAITQAQSSVV